MADFTKQHVSNLFTHLKLLNVDSFEIEFDGSGDSGQIEEVTFYDSGNEVMDIPEDTISWVYSAYDDTKPDEQYKPQEHQVTLQKAVEDLGYNMLDESGHDWYNNDGGYGRIHVQVEGEDGKPKVKMDMNIRITDEESFEYGNDNFTMFAEDGKHEKTESRELMDAMLKEIAARATTQGNA